MTNSTATVAFSNTELAADSAAYVEALYEQYLADNDSVSEEWQRYFADYRQDTDAPHNAIKEQFLLLARNQTGAAAIAAATPTGDCDPKQMAVQQLISAYRRRGHRKANLDPLGLHPRPEVEDLTLAFHGLSEADLDTVFPTNDLAIGKSEAKLREIIEILERVYCGSIGYINYNGDMDTSITIRTLITQTTESNQNKIYCWAGGGIVADSDAEAEYQESFDKVAKILPILETKTSA